eukprot:6214287-Pleurochrysis_carterae.AAC.1
MDIFAPAQACLCSRPHLVVLMGEGCSCCLCVVSGGRSFPSHPARSYCAQQYREKLRRSAGIGRRYPLQHNHRLQEHSCMTMPKLQFRLNGSYAFQVQRSAQTQRGTHTRITTVSTIRTTRN